MNLKVYDGKKYNYVITNGVANTDSAYSSPKQRMSGKDSVPEEEPTYASIQCGDVRVTYYPTGSPEYERLNQRMSASLEKAYRLSKENNMPKYFGLD